MGNTVTTQAANWYANNPQGDPSNILKMLLAPTSNPDSAQSSLGPATLTQMGKVGASTGDAIGPYQEGVAKALKNLGEKHVQDAVAAGADPINDIQNHPVMNQNQNDPTQLLAGLIAAHVANQSQSTQQQTTQNNTNQLAPIQQQALDIVSKPNNFIQAFGQAFNNASGANQQQLQNLAAAQKIAAGQPAEIGLPQAEQQAIQQKMAGQEPLQPTDIATIKANVNKLNLDSLNMSSQRLDADLKTRQDAIEASQKTINLMGKLGGMFSGTGTTITPMMKQLQKEIDNIKQVKARVDAKIANFQPNNPTGQGTEINPNADPALVQEARKRGLIK